MNNNQETNETTRGFNPREHLIQLKSREGSKDYLPVQFRLVWVNEEVKKAVEAGKKVELEITSEIVALDMDRECESEQFVWNQEKRRSEKIIKTDKGYCIYRAKARLRIDDMVLIGTGDKMETKADFKDFVEKAQTGAEGRALAAIGFGTQFAPELDEAHRIVDAPVDRGSTPNNASNGNRSSNPVANNTPPDENAEATITEQQVSSIRKLCQHLGKSEPNNVTSISFLSAKRLIQQLTNEYKESRNSNKSA